MPGSGGEVNGEETVNRDKYDDKKKYKLCPKCGNNLINTDYLYFYCDMCGQKLDWRANDEKID